MQKWAEIFGKKQPFHLSQFLSAKRWSTSNEGITVLVGVFLFALLLALGLLFQNELNTIVARTQAHYFLGVLVYIVFLATSVVLAPLSSLPLVPFAGEIWGIALAGTFSVIGWWLGGLLAFQFVRWFGRPFLSHFISFEKLDSWEKKVPENITFIGIVLVELILPGAIPSFVLGLSKKIPFCVFALASLLGIIPTTYLLVAAGGAFLAQDWFLFVGSGVALLLLIGGVSLYWKKYYQERRK